MEGKRKVKMGDGSGVIYVGDGGTGVIQITVRVKIVIEELWS